MFVITNDECVIINISSQIKDNGMHFICDDGINYQKSLFISYELTEIPEGVAPYTHCYTTEKGFYLYEKPIPEPRPPTPEERIKALEEERLGLQLALAESIEKQEIDKVNNQLALAELVETLTMKGVL